MAIIQLDRPKRHVPKSARSAMNREGKTSLLTVPVHGESAKSGLRTQDSHAE